MSTRRMMFPALILLTSLVSSTYTFPLLVLTVGYLLLKRHGRIPKAALRPLAPLAVLLLLGCIFIDYSSPFAALKDGWYLSKIAVLGLIGLLLGLAFAPGEHWFRSISLVAVFLGIINTLTTMLGLTDPGTRALSFFAVFLAPLIWRYGPHRNHGWVIRLLLVAPILIMLATSGSRAGFLTLVIAIFASRNVFHSHSRAVLWVLPLIAALVAIYPMLPKYNMQDITLLGKLQNAIHEISFQTGENERQMYADWRGFEAYRGFQTWLAAPMPQQIVGLGLGTPIDLGRDVAFNGREAVHYLPFLHNAYFTMLVKTGVLGVFAFVVFMAYPFRISAVRDDNEAQLVAQMSRGTAVTLLLLSVLISGPLNKESLDSLVLVWGWSIGAVERLRKLRGPDRPPAALPLRAPAGSVLANVSGAR